MPTHWFTNFFLRLCQGGDEQNQETKQKQAQIVSDLGRISHSVLTTPSIGINSSS